MARSWEMSPADARAGDSWSVAGSSIPRDGPEGRAVCILPGSLGRQGAGQHPPTGARRPGPRQRDRDRAHARAAHAGGACGARAMGHAHGRLGCPRAGAPQRDVVARMRSRP